MFNKLLRLRVQQNSALFALSLLCCCCCWWCSSSWFISLNVVTIDYVVTLFYSLCVCMCVHNQILLSLLLDTHLSIYKHCIHVHVYVSSFSNPQHIHSHSFTHSNIQTFFKLLQLVWVFRCVIVFCLTACMLEHACLNFVQHFLVKLNTILVVVILFGVMCLCLFYCSLAVALNVVQFCSCCRCCCCCSGALLPQLNCLYK